MRKVAIDTSVLSALAEQRPTDEVELKRWTQIHASVRAVQESGAHIVLPAPVLAELLTGPPAVVALGKMMMAKRAHLTVKPFDEDAAELAGEITRLALKGREKGANRVCIKYDVMILATSIAHGCTSIITSNARDFAPIVAASQLGSRIHVVDAENPMGQITLIG